MMNRRTTHYWLLQLGSALTLSIFWLLANIVPRAELGYPASHDGEIAAYARGSLFYGWPKIFKVEAIIQSKHFEDYPSPRYSIKHFMRIEEFQLASFQRSEFALLSNSVLCVSILCMVSMGIHGLSKGHYSVRMLLASVALAAVAVSSMLWKCSL